MSYSTMTMGQWIGVTLERSSSFYSEVLSPHSIDVDTNTFVNVVVVNVAFFITVTFVVLLCSVLLHSKH